MNNKGFTLVELLAVIVVLGVVTLIGATTVLPLMGQSREKAFLTEATHVIESAENVKDLIDLNQVSLPATSCSDDNKICMTIDDLIDLGYYKGKKENYAGTVTYHKTGEYAGKYELDFKKNTEYAIIGALWVDYINSPVETDKVYVWEDVNETCSCS